MSTRAIKFLRQKHVSFEAVEYEHREKGAVFASEAIGFPLEKTIKTLVVDLGNKKYAMALMPGDKQLDLRHVARACSVKRAVMADTPTAERLTGYFVGGISPFGTKQRMPVIMEKSLSGFDRVAINAGQRGLMLIISPRDIIRLLDCALSELVKHPKSTGGHAKVST